jgi:hypothetical protein
MFTMGYAYSVGFHQKFNQPEVIIFGLEGKTCQNIINAIARRLREGLTLVAGSEHHGILIDLPVAFRAIPPELKTESFKVACAYYGHQNFNVLQCVWPDHNGKFPWQSECENFCREEQVVFDMNEAAVEDAPQQTAAQGEPTTYTAKIITWFSNSPDAGPDCLCSLCNEPIPEGTIPLRIFDTDNNTEARFHNKCLAEVAPALGLPTIQMVDDEDAEEVDDQGEGWDDAFNQEPGPGYWTEL